MTPLDLPTTAVLLLAAMLGGALFGLAGAWRGLPAHCPNEKGVRPLFLRAARSNGKGV